MESLNIRLMKEQFIPYEQAVQLKELGFDEECLMYYMLNESLNNCKTDYVKNSSSSMIVTKCISAPLWQQAFDFFRLNYKLEVLFIVDCFNKGLREYKIISTDKSIVLDNIHDQSYWLRKGCFKTYEEAKLECLKELIKIVQNEKDIHN